MNYKQVDRALSFLNEYNKSIILQVPYAADIKLVTSYIQNKFDGLVAETDRYNTIVFSDYEVKLESVQGNKAGYGYRYPIFFIDRDKDFSYYEWLEVD